MRQKTLPEQLAAINQSIEQLDAAASENGRPFTHVRALLRKRAEDLELKIRNGVDQQYEDRSNGADGWSLLESQSALVAGTGSR